MRKSLAAVSFFLLANVASAQSALDSVMVGPWKIATTYEADKFQNCTMSRSTPTMNIALERNPEGLLLKLDLDDWKLEERQGLHCYTRGGFANDRRQGFG